MPLIPRADSEDTREPEEEEETPPRPPLRTGVSALEDETNAPEGAGIYESGSPTNQNEELVFDPVPTTSLFSFLKENDPAFVEFNGDKILAVLVSDNINTKTKPLDDLLIRESFEALKLKATQLVRKSLVRKNVLLSNRINLTQTLPALVQYRDYEVLDLSKQACSLKEHSHQIVFAIKEKDFKLIIIPTADSTAPSAAVWDHAGHDPPGEASDLYPTSNSLVICDYDSFRDKLKILGRFFRFYGLVLKNPAKGMRVTGVSYKNQAFTLRNKGRLIRFADNFKNLLKELGENQRNSNEDYYIPSFNNNKKITIFFNHNFNSISAIKFTREEGCEKVDQFLSFRKEDIDAPALTKQNTNWFIYTHNQSFPFVANFLFSSASRKKLDPLQAVRQHFLPPGASIKQRKCFEDFNLDDLPGMLSEGFTELALENGTRDLFENKPLKTIEDILREQSLINSPEFNAFRRKVGDSRNPGKTLRDLFMDSLGGKDSFKEGGQEIREDWRSFWEGFDPKIIAYIGLGTLASRAMNGLVDSQSINAFVAKRLGEILADKVSFRKILTSVPMPVLLNIIGSTGLFAPSLLSAMSSNAGDAADAATATAFESSREEATATLNSTIDDHHVRMVEQIEEVQRLQAIPDPSPQDDARLESLAAELENSTQVSLALQERLEFVSTASPRTDEAAMEEIQAPNSPWRREMEAAGFTLSDLDELLKRADENGDEHLARVQSLLIEMVIMAYECGSSGLNKEIGNQLVEAILDAVGLDQFLAQFDDIADFLTAWDIKNIDFCNIPDWPPGGLDFDMFRGINFPRFNLGGLLAFLFPLLLAAIIGLILGLIFMIIRLILGLIPNIPLNLEICEVANYIRDVGVDISDAICKKMKGNVSTGPDLGNNIGRRTAQLAASSFSSKNSVCNFLGLGDVALDRDPRRNDDVAGCIEDFCSLLSPDVSYRFMKGNLDDSEARLLLRVLKNSGKDACEEFANNLENLPNFIDVLNDLGFVIGESIDVDGVFDDLVPFDPETPLPSLNRPPIADICDITDTITPECYEGISDRRLQEIITNNRQRNAALVSDAIGLLTGQTSFDELFRNNAPPPLHPSEMIGDDGEMQMTFTNGASPLISRDQGIIGTLRKDGFAAIFNTLSLTYDGDIRSLIKASKEGYAQASEDARLEPDEPVTFRYVYGREGLAPATLSTTDPHLSSGFHYEGDSSDLFNKLEISTDADSSAVMQIKNNVSTLLYTSLSPPVNSPVIRQWLLDNPNSENFVNLRIFERIVDNRISAPPLPGFFDEFSNRGLIFRSFLNSIEVFSDNISTKFVEKINDFTEYGLGTFPVEEGDRPVPAGFDSFPALTLKPVSTKLSLTNPIYTLFGVERDYFDGFLKETRTLERFEKCSRKYSKVLSRLRDDEVAILDGTLQSNINAELLQIYFEQFYSAYVFGEAMPSLFGSGDVLNAYVQQGLSKKLGVVNYSRFILFSEEIERINGLDIEALRNNPGEFERFLREAREATNEATDVERLREIIEEQHRVDANDYFSKNINFFQKAFKDSFRTDETRRILDVSGIERKEEDEAPPNRNPSVGFISFNEATLEDFSLLQIDNEKVINSVFASDPTDDFAPITPFFYPSIKLDNSDEVINLESFRPGDTDLKNSYTFTSPTLPANTGNLRYTLSCRLRTKDNFIESILLEESNYFSTLQELLLEDYSDDVSPNSSLEAMINKLSAGKNIEVPFEDVLTFSTLGEDAMINSNNLIYKLYDALTEGERANFEIRNRNDILNIFDIQLGISVYLAERSGPLADALLSEEERESHNIFLKDTTTNASYLKITSEEGIPRDPDEVTEQRVIKLLKLADNFVNIEQISFPREELVASPAGDRVLLLPFKLGNGYLKSISSEAVISDYLKDFYELPNLMLSLIINTEIQDILTYAIPIDFILGSLSIYYSDLLKTREEVEYFRRGFKEYDKLTEELFKSQIKKFKNQLPDALTLIPRAVS
jgi:hypothetical protein